MQGSDVHAVLWDFGGVITTSPFDAFAAYEAAHGLEPGFIRRINATDPDTNAWARLERSEVGAEEFAALFEAEAAAAGGRVDAMEILAMLRGQLRPEMVEAVRRCHQKFKTALLTNNFVDPGGVPSLYDEVLPHFDVVVESARAGCRKPDPRFYRIALDQLEVGPAAAVFL
ncbi:MAG TPA: HAD family hydrolase, partial [Acidimicrobiales bacterium]|nr:HAD family hydrolase [Acidimicrobiales bacterium]